MHDDEKDLKLVKQILPGKRLMVNNNGQLFIGVRSDDPMVLDAARMYPESLPEWWYYPFMMFPEEEQYEYRKIYEDYKKNSN